MATTLSEEKIVQQLNNYFNNGYKYVFWYDPNNEFSDTVNKIASSITAKVYHATKNQQFKTKLDLINDSNNSYLVYASYERPKIQENFLTDMEMYSKLFTADANQVILEELHLSDDKLSFVKKYRDFFRAKSRREAFIKYWSSDFDSFPEKGIIAAITKTEKLDVNELLMKVISENNGNENKFIFDFAKYNVLNAFWKVIQDYFNYSNDNADLDELLQCLYVTYLSNELATAFPKQLNKYVLQSVDNTQIFIDRFSDSNRYCEYFDNEATLIWHDLNLEEVLSKLSLTDLVKVTEFEEVNHIILDKLRSRFNKQKITDYEMLISVIVRMTDERKTNQSQPVYHEYKFLQYSAELFNSHISINDTWQDNLNSYIKDGYQIDTIYRKALQAFNQIQTNERLNYQEIKRNLDFYYENNLLDQSIKQWNRDFKLSDVPDNLRQERFYHNYVRDIRERVVVIFSDAFRYEVAKELEDRLNVNDRLSLKMNYSLTGLPSVTYTGMNVMLPHNTLEWDAKTSTVKVNGKNAENTENRTKILQEYDENNLAFRVKDLLKMTSKEIKQLIAGKNVLYLYHNQIDSKGHDLKTAGGLIEATETAIQELEQAIQVLRTNNVSHIIVTADHGFIYHENPISDVNKIDLHGQEYRGQAHLRYLITPDTIDVKGVKHTNLGESLSNDDQTNVYYPSSANIFVAKSGSKNYVHGGSSLQEMVIPVLDIKASSRKSQAKPAEIKLAATNYKINNLKMNLLFNQIKPISDLVLPTEYNVYFTDDVGTLISNTITVEANRKGSAADRTIPITVTIQNSHYDRNKDYYLVVESSDGEQVKKYNYSMELFEE